MRKHFIRLAAAGGAIATMLVPKIVGAADRVSNPTSVGSFSDVQSAINAILKTIVGIAGTVLVIMLVVGGIRYLSNAGNEEEVAKAKKLILDAIIGLIITLAAYAIGTYVMAQLGGNVGVI